MIEDPNITDTRSTRFASITLGRPFAIPEDDIDVTVRSDVKTP